MAIKMRIKNGNNDSFFSVTRHLFHLLALLLIPLCALLGCSSLYVKSADREVGKLIQNAETKVSEERRQSWALAERKIEEIAESIDLHPNEDTPASEEKSFGTPTSPLELTLDNCLELAVERNKDYLSRQEIVYFVALDLTYERYRWIPQPYVNGGMGITSDLSMTVGAYAGLWQRLPLGGAATVEGVYWSDLVDVGSGTIRVGLIQPILRYAGHKVAWESLKQAERDLIYELRDLELFREDFTIDIARRYYDLLRQHQFVENAQQNYDSFRFLREKSEELFSAGLCTSIDVFRAKQEELRAEDNWIAEQDWYDFDLDSFKIQLGLPTDACIDPVEEDLTYEPIEMKMTKALVTAIESRLDLKTARDRLDDAKRRVEIAKNALLPQLDISGGYFLDSGESELSMELNIELPLDRKRERNNMKSAMISLDQDLRQYALTEDRIKQEVRDSLRRLRRLATTIAIQEKSKELAEQRLLIAKQLVESGKLSNRDWVEAQDELMDAKNNLIQALVDYNIAKLTVKRDIGILQIDEKGKWIK